MSLGGCCVLIVAMNDSDTTDPPADEVAEALAALLAQAARLRELPLEAVEPAPPVPDWQ